MTDTRAAIVTGGSRGIGLAIAERLAGLGFGVTLVARTDEGLRSAAARLPGDRVLTVAADLSDGDIGAGLIERHLDRFDRLDVLVANAGTGTVADLEQQTRRRIDRTIDLNLRAPLLLAQAALPALKKAGEVHGRSWVVLLSSITGKAAPPRGYAVYGATKAALISLARSLNVEANDSGVRAVALCPGYVDTDMTDWVHDEVPKSAMLPVSDIAETVDFLLRLSPNTVIGEIMLTRLGAALTEP